MSVNYHPRLNYISSPVRSRTYSLYETGFVFTQFFCSDCNNQKLVSLNDKSDTDTVIILLYMYIFPEFFPVLTIIVIHVFC